MNTTAAFRTHESLIADVARLACEAGESGCPLLEVGLTLIVQASRYPMPVRSHLASVGMLQLTTLDMVTKGEA